MINCMVWMVMCLGIIVAAEVEDPLSSIVLSELGVIMKKEGVVTMDNEMLISLLIKLPIPKIPITTCERKNCKDFYTCQWCNKQITCAVSTHDKHYTNEEFKKAAERQIEDFRVLSLNLARERNNRKKRYIGIAALGVGLLDMAFSTISTHRLSKHIQTLEQRFDHFEMEQSNIKKNLIQIDQEVVHFYNALSQSLENKISDMKCETESDIKTVTMYLLLEEWEKKLETLFNVIKQGSVTGPVTPYILKPRQVKELIENHPNLKNTLYNTKMAYFYAAAEMTIVNASLLNDNVNIHYVMNIPRMNKKNTFPLYKIHQVEISKNKEKGCMQVYMAVLVFRKDGRIYDLPEHCEKRRKILQCPMTEINTLESCVTNNTNCQFTKTSCKSRTIYDKTGMMIAQVGTIFGDTGEKIVQAHPNKYGTIFMPWEKYKKITFNNVTYVGPDFAPKHIKWEPEDKELWSLMVKNISWKFSQERREQLQMKEDNNQSSRKHKPIISRAWWITMTVTGSVASLIWIATILYCTGKIISCKKTCHKTDYVEAITEEKLYDNVINELKEHDGSKEEILSEIN